MHQGREPVVVAAHRSGPGHVRASITRIDTRNGDLIIKAVTGDERGHRIQVSLPFAWLLTQLPKICESERAHAETQAIEAHKSTATGLRARHADAIIEGMLQKIYKELERRFEDVSIESWCIMRVGVNAFDDEEVAAEAVSAAQGHPDLFEPTPTERLLAEHLSDGYDADLSDSVPADLAGLAECYDCYDNPAAGLRARDELQKRVQATD